MHINGSPRRLVGKAVIRFCNLLDIWARSCIIHYQKTFVWHSQQIAYLPTSPAPRWTESLEGPFPTEAVPSGVHLNSLGTNGSGPLTAHFDIPGPLRVPSEDPCEVQSGLLDRFLHFIVFSYW